MKIEKSEALGRDIRREDVSELTRSTWDGLREALRDGNRETALAALKYGADEAKMTLDSAINFANDALKYLEATAGSDERGAALQTRYQPMRERSGRITESWRSLEAAISAGEFARVLASLDAHIAEATEAHDEGVSHVDDALTHIARRAGEEHVNLFLRKRYEPLIRLWVERTPSVKESLERALEYQRAHFADLEVREEEDRYVVICNPCGSGGRLRRNKNVARLEGGRDWTWNKEQVPVYCAHCAVMWEILPMENRGAPIRINLPPQKDSDPCVHLYYKTPEAIPDEYFERVSRPRSKRPTGER